MGSVARKDMSIQSVGLNPNPVNTGNALIISVGVNPGEINTWEDISVLTWGEVATMTWNGGPIEPVNLYSADNQDYATYIRYANQILGPPCTSCSNESTSIDNRCAQLTITPGKTYTVHGDFDTRFRVATLNHTDCHAQFVVTNYIFDELDHNDTSVVGDDRTLTITAGADHDLMLIGYYTSTGTVPFATIKNTIEVFES